MSQHEIAEELGIDPAAISRALTYLEKYGFIVIHAVNGCKNGIALTVKATDMKPINETKN